MKIKSGILIVGSMVGLCAYADSAQEYQVTITNFDTKKMMIANDVIGKFSDQNGGVNYDFLFNSETRVAKVRLNEPQQIDELLHHLKTEFGESINIEKVPVDVMAIGTQDDQVQ